MLPRVLEPEVMDSPDDAQDYDSMDHTVVNEVFVTDLLKEVSSLNGLRMKSDDDERPLDVLDLGTGTAQSHRVLQPSRFYSRDGDRRGDLYAGSCTHEYRDRNGLRDAIQFKRTSIAKNYPIRTRCSIS